MHPSSFPPLPTETVAAAKSVFNIENVYLSIGDQLEHLLRGINPADLDASGWKQPGSLTLFAMVTIFQFAENLPDRLAGEAVRTRTDWKYALHLSLTHPGVNPGELCEFRQRLLQDTTGQQVFQSMLVRLAEAGILSSRLKNWTNAKSVLLEVCSLSRVDWLAQSMSLTLEVLAAYKPELLRELALPYWYERYNRKFEILLQTHPEPNLEGLAVAIGKDILYLLEALIRNHDLNLMQLQEPQDLRRTFHRQFDLEGDQVKWRVVCTNCSGLNAASLYS